jgi:hypothetical protein
MEDAEKRSHTSIWSLPLLCLGLCLIAVCVLVPAKEANRRLTADRDKLKRDLSYVESQLSANQEFLSIAGSDPEVSERLAQRQFREIRQGTRVLQLDGVAQKPDSSPFQMVSVTAPPPVAGYHPPRGVLGDICQDARRQLYAIGVGMFVVALALVIGVSSPGPMARPKADWLDQM